MKLKSVPRTGWLDRGRRSLRVESVADHSFGVALLAWGCALQRHAEGVAIDPERVLKLAVIHDLAEAETGDLPPYDPAAIPDEHDPRLAAHFLKRVTAVIRIATPQSEQGKTRRFRNFWPHCPAELDRHSRRSGTSSA